MIAKRATGRSAHVLKYDLLTALGAYACTAGPTVQRITLRFMTLIVARYNWQTDELAVGQREMATLWSIDTRSVVREVARLRNMGWLVERRPAARGRVTTHGLGIPAILSDTTAAWGRVGPDFAARMGAEPEVERKVITLPAPRSGGEQPGDWGQVLRRMHDDDPALQATWIAPLQIAGLSEGILQLRAPSRFHAAYVQANHIGRLTAAATPIMPGLRRIEVTA